ncbi:TonB family protein [Paracoccus sp. M683]|uniref:TonB family protein n=1 Tax=Paracoccus sp. M683 TaxID=2594268 RepID=UPI00117CEABC|nr:TonB family protein [Paracoccus sp. M683]TRW96007.1 TonB family protein [Paracoccus sp. M683]
MTRFLGALAYLLLSVTLLLILTVLLKPGLVQGGQQKPAEDMPVTLASAQMAATVAAWEAPPQTAPMPEQPPEALPEPANLPEPPQIEPVQPPEPELAQPDMPDPVPAEVAPAMTLPPMRPQMTQQMTLPTAPPEIVSALLLSSSDRPAARPERRAPRAETKAKPRQPQREAPRQQQAAAAPRQQPSPQPQQQAAQPRSGGSGGGGGGTAAAAQQRAAANAPQLTAQWGAQIRSCISRRARAPSSLRQGGQVALSLRVGRNGAIQAVGIAGSSGNPQLDQAVLQAAQRVGRCPAAPRGLENASYSFTLPIQMTLR